MQGTRRPGNALRVVLDKLFYGGISMSIDTDIPRGLLKMPGFTVTE